jgi:NAD(P)-dependent dehydrogenase (short-subunit alcohol dehydrogenase family)
MRIKGSGSFYRCNRERPFNRDLMDRLVLPGALGFTRFGYALRKRSWTALPKFSDEQVAVVTGATSGLGRVTAERLAELGARVIIGEATGGHRLQAEVVDLSLKAHIRDLANRLLRREDAIHMLVNNAAVLPSERKLTTEGLETAFATDLLSPFLLTELLLPKMRSSAPARVINVLSGGMYLSGVDVDDLENARGKYDGSRAYARAKRGLMILTEHWASRLEGAGVTVNAMHPGWADTPGVRESLPGFHKLTRPVLRTPEQGADTIVWLAASPEAAGHTGKFWLDREPHLSAIFPGTAGSRSQRIQLINELERLAA